MIGSRWVRLTAFAALAWAAAATGYAQERNPPPSDPANREAAARRRGLGSREQSPATRDESTSPAAERLAPGAPLWPGFAIYLTADGATATDLFRNKTPLEEIPLAAKPVLTEGDIADYDWSDHGVHLKPGNLQRLPRPKTVWGKPFVVVAGGERIYMGGIWTAFSSQSASFPVIMNDGISPSGGFVGGRVAIRQPDFLRIAPGYPGGMKEAPDPRGDARIGAALEKAGLLKSQKLDPGFALYRVLGNPGAAEAEQRKLADLPLAPAPILTLDDIQSYDWEKHEIGLKPGGAARFPQEAPTGGIPFVAVAGGERIYLGGIWNIAADRAPGTPYIAASWAAGINPRGTPADAKSLQIRPAGGNHAGGSDPRGDARIRAALEKAKLIEKDAGAAVKP